MANRDAVATGPKRVEGGRARRAGTAALGATAVVLFALASAPAAPAQGDACSNSAYRIGLPSAHLPDCRAYEQVSPVDKNGADVTYGTPGVSFGPLPVAANGGAAVFRSTGAFAGTPWGGSQVPIQYLSRRGDGAWSTQVLATRPEPAGNRVAFGAVSSGFDKAVIEAPVALTEDAAPFGGLYLQNTVTRELSLLAAPGHSSLLTVPYKWSPDGNHFTFVSATNLTGGPGVPGGNKAWEFEDGQLRLVSVVSGAPVVGQVGSLGNGPDDRSQSNAISRDGEHIFFTTPAGGSLSPNQEIYRRSGATTTLPAAPSKRTDCADDPSCGGDGTPDPEPDPLEGGKKFETATPDGNRVFFTSPELLTDDANTGPGRAAASPRELYRYDFAADEMIAISAETNDVDGAAVLGVVGVSDDGDRVYYVARGQVVAGEGVAGQPNLYAWHDDGTDDGDTRFIATLLPFVNNTNRQDEPNWLWSSRKTSRVTPDGRRLLFQSIASLPGHDNGGVSQVYLYDAEDDAVECISCNPFGVVPIGPSDLGRGVGTGVEDPDQLPRYLSEDGTRVFFNSLDALVADDTNGQLDVYMWQEGRLHLISTGKSTDESFFYGASSNGDEAFLLTRGQLVGWDRDTALDLYVAKVGGGFPEPVPPVLCNLLGDACQGPGDRPDVVFDRTAEVIPDGNAPTSPRTRLALRRVTAAQRRRAARTGVLRLMVRTNQPGRIRAVARARVRAGSQKARSRIVARGRARASGARRATVRLRLNRAARRQLQRGGRLRLSVRVRQAGARPKSISLTLRRAER